MKLQLEYCKKNNVPHFAPINGECFNCHNTIPDTNKYHITGCPHCKRSYCE